MVECFDVGLSTIGKAAIERGMNHFVFVVYSNALATLILLPLTFFINSITVMQNCVFTAIDYSSPTLGSAMSNLTPAITFVLAVILGMEKLNVGSSISQIKVMGTVLSISGALLVTFYKGSAITSFRIAHSLSQPLPSLLAQTSNWAIGGLFFAAASISLALCNITQAAILKGYYSSQSTIVAFYCLFGTVQSAILAFIVVRDPNDWKISLDIELISIIYSAIVGSILTFSVMTWCIKRKGPVFVSLFKPVSIAIAAFSSVLFLGETLHVGSVLGAVIIAIGFYAVIWAQSKEANAKDLQIDGQSSPSSQASPLLQTVP
ncbi:unnamed protein product [Sphenostylis stenocarpa]|uniref:WAT1-related protein n=1 Tax=Sphenostylis stenocarpa TaxID=92480 RepID=A0AA86VE77_9FABA|nr:unnamed protein product [Sphenostylis stenocarpa]